MMSTLVTNTSQETKESCNQETLTCCIRQTQSHWVIFDCTCVCSLCCVDVFISNIEQTCSIRSCICHIKLYYHLISETCPFLNANECVFQHTCVYCNLLWNVLSVHSVNVSHLTRTLCVGFSCLHTANLVWCCWFNRIVWSILFHSLLIISIKAKHQKDTFQRHAAWCPGK